MENWRATVRKLSELYESDYHRDLGDRRETWKTNLSCYTGTIYCTIRMITALVNDGYDSNVDVITDTWAACILTTRRREFDSSHSRDTRLDE